MPVPTLLRSPEADLAAALDTEGEQEYVQLLSMLQHTQGIFALMLVRSDFSPALRDLLMQRLARDLAPASLSIVRVTHTEYNAARMLADAAHFVSSSGVLALIGLEDTPDMVVEGGREQKRPPALATLNHGREALRRACRMPIIVWCSDWGYQTLREHAPDFFDHFTGLFYFKNAFAEERAPFIGNVYTDIVSGAIGISGAVSEVHTPAHRGHFDVSSTLSTTRRENQGLVRASIDFYTKELQTHSAPNIQKAHILLGFAEALACSQGSNQAENLSLAEDAVREALSLLTQDKDAYEWARAQRVRGLIYTLSTADDKAENLQRAIDCFNQALSIYSEGQFPVEWANTQVALGTAHLEFPLEGSNLNWTDKEESRGRRDSWKNWQAHKRIAITCFDNALHVFSREEYPEIWASTQRSLGQAWFFISDGSRTNKKENLKRAIACYEAALDVFSEKNHPHEWAVLQLLLGLAYYCLGDHDRRYLRKSIVCYEAALRAYDQKDYPYSWALTQERLGLAFSAQSKWQEARQTWIAAKQVFHSLGVEDEVKKIDSHLKVADAVEERAAQKSEYNQKQAEGKQNGTAEVEHFCEPCNEEP